MSKNKEIPQSFYGSKVWMSTGAKPAYKRYCIARDAWLQTLDKPTGQTILDIGCSTGDALAPWTAENDVHGLDHDHDILKIAASRGFITKQGDMMNLPFKDAMFDQVCGFGIIGSAKNPQDCFREHARVLKPNGQLYLAVAVLGGLRLITRSLTKLLRIKTQMVTIPTVTRLENDLAATGFALQSLSTTPLVPTTNLSATPSAFDRAIATYAFVTAIKTK